jgi:hypothetical protein
MLRAVETLLPRDPPGQGPANPADRREIHVDGVDCQYFPDLASWFARVRQKWQETHAVPAGDESAEPPAAPVDAAADPAADPAAEPAAAPVETGPKGPGWVIQIRAHHFHNEDRHKPDEDEQFVRSTLVRGLLGKGDMVRISAGPRAGELVPVGELGIGYPVIVESSPVTNVDARPPSAAGAPPVAGDAAGAPAADRSVKLRRYDFVLQFIWQPPVPGAAPQAAAP